MTTQSATYQQLKVVLVNTGCPICRLSHQMVHDYLAGLLWESVNDPGIRASLVAALGFCGPHSRELLTFPGERIGVAILQNAVMLQALQRLPVLATLTQPTLLQKLQDRLAVVNEQPAKDAELGTLRRSCPACLQQAQIEARAVQTLVEHLIGDLEKPLRRAGGLCLPHLEQALHASKQPAQRQVLIHMHRQLWEQLTTQLGEFVRKQDHRFHKEKITDEERAAIERSIAILTGE
jgi:hypothetical protein